MRLDVGCRLGGCPMIVESSRGSSQARLNQWSAASVIERGSNVFLAKESTQYLNLTFSVLMVNNYVW